MTDIVERLRNPGTTPGCPDCGAVALHAPTVTRDMAEAADEIERLRTDSGDWERMSEKHRAAWVSAAQERDRMKAACQLMIDGKWDAACKAARAALGEAKS